MRGNGGAGLKGGREGKEGRGKRERKGEDRDDGGFKEEWADGMG